MKKGNYHSLTAAFFILSFTLIIALSTTGQAGAQSDLFSEDFQGYTFPPATPTLNGGIPKKSEGADKVWYGGRFDTPDTGTIDSDLAVGRSSSSSTANVFGRFEDEAGLLFNISTLGYTNVLLSFDYATYSAIDSDRLVAGYFIGELGFGTPTCTGEGEAGCFSNFTGSPTENWGNWTEILRYQGSTWQSTTHALPAGQESVWVAFWLDDGAGDHGMIDNIHVTATVVPEPISSTLFLVGAATLGYRRFRKKR